MAFTPSTIDAEKVLELARLIGACHGNCGSKKAKFLSNHPKDVASLFSGFAIVYAQYYDLDADYIFDEVGSKGSQLREDFAVWREDYIRKLGRG